MLRPKELSNTRSHYQRVSARVVWRAPRALPYFNVNGCFCLRYHTLV